jgi:hypothetical protein
MKELRQSLVSRKHSKPASYMPRPCGREGSEPCHLCWQPPIGAKYNRFKKWTLSHCHEFASSPSVLFPCPRTLIFLLSQHPQKLPIPLFQSSNSAQLWKRCKQSLQSHHNAHEKCRSREKNIPGKSLIINDIVE